MEDNIKLVCNILEEQYHVCVNSNTQRNKDLFSIGGRFSPILAAHFWIFMHTNYGVDLSFIDVFFSERTMTISHICEYIEKFKYTDGQNV